MASLRKNSFSYEMIEMYDSLSSIPTVVVMVVVTTAVMLNPPI
jgi:hypothetical protein